MVVIQTGCPHPPTGILNENTHTGGNTTQVEYLVTLTLKKNANTELNSQFYTCSSHEILTKLYPFAKLVLAQRCRAHAIKHVHARTAAGASTLQHWQKLPGHRSCASWV